MTAKGYHSRTTVLVVSLLLLGLVSTFCALPKGDGAELPPELPPAPASGSGSQPQPAPAGVINYELRNEVPLEAAEANRGTVGARKLHVHVDGAERRHGLPVPVELLFGERDGLRNVNLLIDRAGDATWPSGSEAPRPRFADFAFPTISRTGTKLAADAESVTLTMPTTCVLDLEVVEVDGEVTGEEVTAYVRSAAASWPANRWRPLKMQNGRGKVLCEAAGQRVEVRGLLPSGRSLRASFTAATEAGVHVPCSIKVAPSNGLEVVVQGLPELPVESRNPWRVVLHNLADPPVLAHRWPSAANRYVAFPTPAVREAASPWLVLANQRARPGELWWGTFDGGDTVAMTRCAEIATGRVVDQNGKAASACGIDLVVRKSGVVLHGVVSGNDGAFALPGPDPGKIEVDVVSRERVDGKPAPVPLPSNGNIELQVRR